MFRFQCEDLTIYVKFNDKLTLVCPQTFLYSRDEANQILARSTYEKIYFVEEKDKNMFENCNTTGKQ